MKKDGKNFDLSKNKTNFAAILYEILFRVGIGLRRKNNLDMNTLEELTNKIYSEGVEKGKAEAAAIVEKAQKEAQVIIEKAQKEASQTLASAEQKAREIEANTKSELRLYMDQSVNALKTEITDMITDRLVSDSVKAATADATFMQGVIMRMASQMVQDGAVCIEAKDAAALIKYFEANAKGLLEKGIEIKEVKGLKTDFSIRSVNGGYKLNFGQAEFKAYFKEFVRPQLAEMLF